jgi:hypothetical protein
MPISDLRSQISDLRHEDRGYMRMCPVRAYPYNRRRREGGEGTEEYGGTSLFCNRQGKKKKKEKKGGRRVSL